MGTLMQSGRRPKVWTSLLGMFAMAGLLMSTDLVIGDHPGGGGRPLSAFLTGDAEVPGPGHPDATGTADIRLNPGQEEVMFHLTFEGLDPTDDDDLITAGHIHVGEADVAGPVVVDFEIPGPLPVDEDGAGEFSGRVSADRDLIRDIMKNPDGYYVNLHSPNFGPGAIRGQLSK